jgi:tRNA U34 2-thiouridine synthase MnmA/TrmU
MLAQAPEPGGREGAIVPRARRAARGRHDASTTSRSATQRAAHRRPGPLYVVGIETETNTVIAGGEDELFSAALDLERVNWVSSPRKPLSVRARVRIRFRGDGCMAT